MRAIVAPCQINLQLFPFKPTTAIKLGQFLRQNDFAAVCLANRRSVEAQYLFQNQACSAQFQQPSSTSPVLPVQLHAATPDSINYENCQVS